MNRIEVSVSVPPKIWCHKPRSEKTDGGFFSKFRGAGSWQRRWVGIENYALSYGEVLDEKLKTIPLEKIISVEKVPRERIAKAEGPEHLLDCGWQFAYDAKVVLFVASSPEARDAYVTYLEAFIEAMKARASGGGGGAGGGAGGGSGAGAGAGDDGGDDGGDATNNSNNAGAGMTLAAMAAAAASGNQVGAVPGASGPPISGGGGGAGGEGDDEGDGSGGGGGRRNFTADQLNNMMGGGDDDAINVDSLNWNDEDDEDDEDDDDDSDDDDDDDDDDDEGSAAGRRRKKRGAVIVDAPRLMIERQLRQIAQTPHNHIAFKLDKYASSFEDGDTVKDVVFSRSVFKISKKNNNNDRDLVVTGRKVYLFSVGGLLDRVSVRSFPIPQIVGVVESTESSSLFAILIPSYHDVLLRIAPQNSVIGGTEAEVKTQLIAHLFALCQELAPGRQFLFREAANVPSIIRRSEDDEHQPLRSEEDDRFRISSKPELFPKFRVNAESVVYLSVHVQRVNAEMSYSPRIFVLTDGGVYLVHLDMERIAKRSSLTDVSQMKCDPEMHGILLELPEMDMVIYAKTQSDYQLMIRWVPEAAMRGCRHTVRVSQSRNLLAGARLQDAKKLMEHLARAGTSTEEGFKSAFKAVQRLGKSSVKMSKEGLGWMSKRTGKLVDGSVDLVKSGASGLGGALMDNAFTGELRGMAEGMLDMAGAVSDRVVAERIIKLSDVDRFTELREPTMDSLKMAGSQALQTFGQSNKDKLDTSIVFFSARCKHYALTSSVETNKSSDMFLLLTASGILLFNDQTGSTTSLMTGSKTLLSRAFSAITGGQMGLSLHEFVPWSETRGIMRCVAEPNLIGVINATGAGTLLRDYMLRLPNAKLAEGFVTHFLNLYAASQTPPAGRGFWKVLPGLYTAATGEHLRKALKGSAFEPDATIALRVHPLGGDELLKAVDPLIVDRVRRYGDNSVRFSSVAWRLKTSTMRKDGGKEALKAANEHGPAEAGSHGAGLDRKLYKQCELMLTNCAVYQFEEDGKVVNRRLELLDVTRVKRCATDPDAVLLVVPRQFDFYIRIEGRAQEFVDKLVEARNEWSDFELELPVEINQDTFLPVNAASASEQLQQAAAAVVRSSSGGAGAGAAAGAGNNAVASSSAAGGAAAGAGAAAGGADGGAAAAAAAAAAASGSMSIFASISQKHQPLVVDNISDPVTTVGRLVKPKTFSAEQDGIVADDVLSQYKTMLMLEIRRTLEEKDSSQTFACSGADANALAVALERAAQEFRPVLHFERAIARVRFATERAFSFGLRPHEPDCAAMALGLTLLEFHRRWREILTRLHRAVKQDLLTEFQSAESDARALASTIQQKFQQASDQQQQHQSPSQHHPPRIAAALSFVDAITTAVELMKPQLEAMKSRALVKSDIERLVQRAAKDGPEGVLADLEESVMQAEELGVHSNVLDSIRASFDSAVQAYRMNKIAAHAWSPTLTDVFDEARTSIQQQVTAAGSSGAGGGGGGASSDRAPHGHLHGQEKTQNETITWSLRTLDAAVNAGDLHQLDFALRCVELCWKDDKKPEEVQRAMARAKQLSDQLRVHEGVLGELKRVSESFRRSAASLTADELARYEREFAEVLSQLPRGVPSLRAARDTAFVLFSTVQLRRKAAEQHEAAIDEEKAAAAAYSKTASDDALASARRYERAQRLKQEEARLQRREEMHDVAKRGSALLFDVKRAVAAEDVERVAALANTIDTMRRQMEDMLRACASDEEIRSLDDLVLGFQQHLDEAHCLARVFEEQTAARRGAAAVPPEALAAAQKLDTAALCAFVQSGELDIASLKVLGEVWGKAAEHKKKVHRLRQRAFVLDTADDEAVQQLLNDATVLCVENDVVIAKVREQHRDAKKKRRAADSKSKPSAVDTFAAAAAAAAAPVVNADGEAGAAASGGGDDDAAADLQQPIAAAAAAAATPKFVPPAVYDNNYPWVSSKGGGVFLDVHGTLSTMLRKDGIINSTKETGRYEFPPKDHGFSNDVKDFCGRMERFFMHRVKPSGFFRKTPRSFFDLITDIGKIKRGDNIVAPFCSHLVGEFERVKKLNNANGLTSDQVLVRLILSKRGDLQRIFDELGALTTKERENLFLEDSMWMIQDDVASKDMTLFAKMCAQIVWPFSFTDRRNPFDGTGSSSTASSVAPGSPAQSGGGGLNSSALAALAASGPSPSGSMAGGASGSHVDLLETGSIALSQAPSAIAKDMGPGGPTAEQAVATLRNAVRVLGSFFQAEMRRLGVESTAEQRRQIFDETRTKMCGVLVRDEVCAAIAMLFRSGIKSPQSFMQRFQKRAPWDVVVAATDSVRKSAHGLSAVALPEAVDTVLSLTDPSMSSSSRRGQSAVSKMNAQQLSDVRFRIFLCFTLNRKILSSVVLNAMFAPDTPTGAEMVEKFYDPARCAFLDQEYRAEIAKIFEYLEKLPFVLSVDAEIW